MITKRLVCFAIAAVSGATTFNAVADGSGSGANSWIGYVFGGNLATAPSSAVAAGSNNVASGQGAFVGAGVANQANGISSLVIGGFDNRAVAIDSLVGAGAGNRAVGARSIIVGGGYNLASGNFSFIGGGGRDGIGSTAAGSDPVRDNRAFGKWSVIGGGRGNVAGVNGSGDTVDLGTVTGGGENTASGQYSTVGGGFRNTASGTASTVAGGRTNIAGDIYSSVTGGIDNHATGYIATVAGGDSNTASGSYSFAAGRGAIAGGHGSFAIADSCCFGLDFPVAADNSFGARYTGGFTFASSVNPTTGLFATGCQLFSGGGSWACSSDRDTKTAFDVIDPRSILQNVVDMPVTRWRFQGETESVRHIGPMAQDFHAAFGLGHDDKSISMLDAQGVALAAIQGLHQLVQEMQATMQQTLREKDGEIAALKAETSIQRQGMAELRRAVQVLLARSPERPQFAHR